MELTLLTILAVVLITAFLLWRRHSEKVLWDGLREMGFTHPSEWKESEPLSDEQMDRIFKEEDSKILEWASGDKDGRDIFGDNFCQCCVGAYGFPEEYAGPFYIERFDHRRLSLLADLIGSNEISEGKRAAMLSALYMRLNRNLSSPKKFLIFDPTQEFTRESQKSLLNWRATYKPVSPHGAIEEYCKDVKEMLDKRSKYKSGFFHGKYHGITYDQWLNTVLWPRREKWFPKA